MNIPEVDPNDEIVRVFLIKLNAFNDRKTEECIHCGKHVTSLHKVGRCVYAHPCGCRMWQGMIPAAWMRHGGPRE